MANCVLIASLQSVQCFQDVPPWWGLPESISPDGRWVVVHYIDPDDPQWYKRAILPRNCLEEPSQTECAPKIIPDPDNEALSTTRLFVDWTVDGTQLVFVNADGLVTSKTTIWSYDLASGRSRVLASYPGTDVYAGSWTSDGVHFILIDGEIPGNQKVWLVSSTTGQMQQVSGIGPGILDVLGIFQVP
jgi:Tol biopolymer transport system component